MAKSKHRNVKQLKTPREPLPSGLEENLGSGP